MNVLPAPEPQLLAVAYRLVGGAAQWGAEHRCRCLLTPQFRAVADRLVRDAAVRL